MKDTLIPGLEHELRFVATEAKMVPALYPESPDFRAMPVVLATGYLVGFLEWCALLLANESAMRRHGLTPKARVVTSAVAGVAPRIMGFGPAPAMRKVLAQAKLALSAIDVIELNEAFAAQALAVTRDHGLTDDAAHVNPNGGAVALGHPIGATGSVLTVKALYELQRIGGRYALVTMCIGGGQGIAAIFERA